MSKGGISGVPGRPRGVKPSLPAASPQHPFRLRANFSSSLLLPNLPAQRYHRRPRTRIISSHRVVSERKLSFSKQRAIDIQFDPKSTYATLEIIQRWTEEGEEEEEKRGQSRWRRAKRDERPSTPRGQIKFNAQLTIDKFTNRSTRRPEERSVFLCR